MGKGGGASGARGGGGGGGASKQTEKQAVLEKTLTAKDLSSNGARDRTGGKARYGPNTVAATQEIADKARTGDQIHIKQTMKDGTSRSVTVELNSDSMKVVSNSLPRSQYYLGGLGTSDSLFKTRFAETLAAVAVLDKSKVKSVQVSIRR